MNTCTQQSCQIKRDPPSQNRAWGSGVVTIDCTAEILLQVPETTSETSPACTITVSGIPCWPNRDPIGESGFSVFKKHLDAVSGLNMAKDSSIGLEIDCGGFRQRPLPLQPPRKAYDVLSEKRIRALSALQKSLAASERDLTKILQRRVLQPRVRRTITRGLNRARSRLQEATTMKNILSARAPRAYVFCNNQPISEIDLWCPTSTDSCLHSDAGGN